MNKFFYPKLAMTNLKKNSKTYVPYIISAIVTIMMYYIMHALSVNPGLNNMPGSTSLTFILSLGTVVIAIFSCIFLFYTNSFLMKRRKTEFGLYNILGMEKRHIFKVIFFETVYTAVISLVVGLFGGILLNKLMYLLLIKLLHFDVKLGFDFSAAPILMTLLLFGTIFLLTFLNALRQIHLSKPIELLKGSQTGEKEPKTKWILTIIGFVTLGAGYYIALSTESPLDAILLFFVAVILVIIGTYLLFMTGSIAVLKMLRRNKRYYYKTKHFISVSGMIYRMKQNSVGLANICILSTAVLIMLSTTISLYIGLEDALRTRYPENIAVDMNSGNDEDIQKIDTLIDDALNESNVSIKNKSNYQFYNFYSKQEQNQFLIADSDGNYNDFYQLATVNLITLEQFNKLENRNETLESNEVFLYTIRGENNFDTIKLMDKTYNIKEKLSQLNVTGGDALAKSYFVVIPDYEQLKEISSYYDKLNDNEFQISYHYGFDSDSDSATQIELAKNIGDKLENNNLSAYVRGSESSRADFLALYGGLLFLGIFLGSLFIVATVLIIYYKQISEGYDDKDRFVIMQKVGMSLKEVKSSISSQILTVFFLPLVTAGIHVLFAFKMITKLLGSLGLTNISLFALCTLGTFLIFGLTYAIVYTLTAKSYYKIVS